jgi:hypothetical protein
VLAANRQQMAANGQQEPFEEFTYIPAPPVLFAK